MKKIILSIVMIACIITLASCKKMGLKEESLSFDSDIDYIYVNEVEGDVTIKRGTEDTFEVEYMEDAKKYQMSVYVSGTQLSAIRTDKRTSFDRNGFENDVKTVVTIPSGFSGTIEIKNVVGEVLTSKIAASDLMIDVVAGDIEVYDCEISGDLKIKNTTGKTVIEETSANMIALDTSSGDIDIEDSRSSTLVEILADSGKTSVNGLKSETIVIRNTNGNVKAKEVDPANSLEITLTTGFIDLSLSGRRSDYKLTAKSSTDQGSNFETSSGSIDVRLQTTVGKITVEYLR